MVLSPEGLKIEFVNYLREILISPFWRTLDQKNWNIEREEDEKSKTGFVGLINLGCTCYINSLMQQFFMMDQLRENLLKIDGE